MLITTARGCQCDFLAISLAIIQFPWQFFEWFLEVFFGRLLDRFLDSFYFDEFYFHEFCFDEFCFDDFLVVSFLWVFAKN